MNDILTLMYLLDEEKETFKTKKANIDVDISDGEKRGKTAIKKGGNVDVVIDADGTKLIREMLVNLFPEKSKEIEEVLVKRQERIEVRDYLLEVLPQKRESIFKLFNEERGVKVMKRMAEMIDDLKNNKSSFENGKSENGEER